VTSKSEPTIDLLHVRRKVEKLKERYERDSWLDGIDDGFAIQIVLEQVIPIIDRCLWLERRIAKMKAGNTPHGVMFRKVLEQKSKD
tara:strand:+ start:4332 stop:4589 length:258 start_codon:yes stop_codon:yes gene_type:complete